MGELLRLASGGDVERVEVAGQPALRAVFEITDSPELAEVGRRRSGTTHMEVVVDPATWLPYAERDETEGRVTEVTFLDFNEPFGIEPPAGC